MFKNLHWHSIIVHVVVAFAPLSALALILESLPRLPAGLLPATLVALERFGVVMILLVSLPSAVTGVLERNKRYARWHATHRAKLLLSAGLIACAVFEILCWFAPSGRGAFSTYGLMVIGVNNLLVFFLANLGLKITLGRQSLEKTSYVPDLFNREHRVDILDSVAVHVHEKAKIVEFD